MCGPGSCQELEYSSKQDGQGAALMSVSPCQALFPLVESYSVLITVCVSSWYLTTLQGGGYHPVLQVSRAPGCSFEELQVWARARTGLSTGKGRILVIRPGA